MSTYLTDHAGARHALLARRAGCDQRKYREATLAEQIGWWVKYKQRFFLELDPPPASLSGCFAISLEVARSALLCEIGQDQSPDSSIEITPPHARGETRTFFPWRSSCAQRSPYCSQSSPRLSEEGCFGNVSVTNHSANRSI